MNTYPESAERLMKVFQQFPGIGPRSAERLMYFILKSDEAFAHSLASAIIESKSRIRQCRECFNLCESELCNICTSPSRDRSVICVVEQPRDLIAIENTGVFRGLYHVLTGRISLMDGVHPEELTINELLHRIENSSVPIKEIIFALDPDIEGDTTALYIAKLLKDKPIKLTRIARGIVSGGSIEHSNRVALCDAIRERREL